MGRMEAPMSTVASGLTVRETTRTSVPRVGVARRTMVIRSTTGIAGLLAACTGPGSAGEPSKVAKPASIEVLHEFGPNSSDGRWMGTMLDRIRERAPHITVTATLTAG